MLGFLALIGLGVVWLIIAFITSDQNKREHCITRSCVYTAAAIIVAINL